MVFYFGCRNGQLYTLMGRLKFKGNWAIALNVVRAKSIYNVF